MADPGLGGELFLRLPLVALPLLRMLPDCAVYVLLRGGRSVLRRRPNTPGVVVLPDPPLPLGLSLLPLVVALWPEGETCGMLTPGDNDGLD